MCDIYGKRKKITSLIEATQMNYLVACAEKTLSAVQATRDTINAIFGDDKEASVHVPKKEAISTVST